MIKADMRGTKENFRASQRMIFTFRHWLVLIVYIVLTVVCFFICANFLKSVFRNKYNMFSSIPAVYIFCGAACFIMGIEMILRIVFLIKGWATIKRKVYLIHKFLTFEEDGYTVSYYDEKGVSFEGRYSYSAVDRMITYRDFICLRSPDDDTTFRLSEITCGTADQLMALLREKLGEKHIAK